LTAVLPLYHCTVGIGNPLALHNNSTKSPTQTLCGDGGAMETIGASNEEELYKHQ